MSEFNEDIDTSFARSLVLDSALLRREIETATAEVATAPAAVEANDGLTVIIPTYRGADRIGAALDSVTTQSLDQRSIEVLVIANGPDDGTIELLRHYQGVHPEVNLRWYSTATPSAGNARNLGLSLARRRYVTFLDDDDEFQPRALEVMLSHARDQAIVLIPIINRDGDGMLDNATSLNERITALQGRTVPVAEQPWILGFNACKLLPIGIARAATYRTDLTSGEDVVYFANLLRHSGLTVVVPDNVEDAAYVRQLRPDSVSRREESYDFNVSARLACIAALGDVQATGPEASALQALQSAQAGFPIRYMQNHPESFDRVQRDISAFGILNFPWHMVTKGRARDLAFCYCFAPFSDTSAVVAAKALVERGRIVDVIANDMSSIRRRDTAVSALAQHLLDDVTLISSPPSFAGWEQISDFARKAVAAAESQLAVKGEYGTVYSRALWVGSHVAALLYKVKHWPVVWTAEFSDPLRRGADGRPRPGAFQDDDLSALLRRNLASRGVNDTSVETVFDLVELATFVLADEVIFTNQNQMDYMLSFYGPQIGDMVRSKATVRHHPVPPAFAYHAQRTSYPMPTGVVNIGYFGSFYANRGIGDVLTAWQNLDKQERRAARLHVFCNKPKELAAEVTRRHLDACIYVNGYRPYMEFLNLATHFDVLLVNDVERDENLPVNPFLPSKYSDYAGSGAQIWGILDEGSPLGSMDLAYRTQVGNVPAIHATLRQIIADGAPSSRIS